MSAISSSHRLAWVTTRAQAVLALAYATGAAALAGVAVVHLQQYVAFMDQVRWVGPLFLANAATCVAIIIGLALRPTRHLAALGGVVVSVLTLAGLVVSYGPGFLGWREAGFRTAIAADVITTVVAVTALTVALAVAARPREPIGRSGAVPGLR
jgi:hypothetical protein